MRAIVLNAATRTADAQDLPSPSLALHELLVHAEMISLNSIDPLHGTHPLASSGRVTESDFAGRIEALGAEVPSTNISRRTRVASFLQGACSMNELPGTFAEHLVVP